MPRLKQISISQDELLKVISGECSISSEVPRGSECVVAYAEQGFRRVIMTLRHDSFEDLLPGSHIPMLPSPVVNMKPSVTLPDGKGGYSVTEFDNKGNLLTWLENQMQGGEW